MGGISLLITTKNANAMGLFNDVIDEIFTKKGIVAFVSGSAGGMIYGTSVTWKNVTRFVLIVVSSGMAARFATPTLSKICGVTNHDDELFLAFIVGLLAMAIIPNLISWAGRLKFKVPKVFASVAEDAKNE